MDTIFFHWIDLEMQNCSKLLSQNLFFLVVSKGAFFDVKVKFHVFVPTWALSDKMKAILLLIYKIFTVS